MSVVWFCKWEPLHMPYKVVGWGVFSTQLGRTIFGEDTSLLGMKLKT